MERFEHLIAEEEANTRADVFLTHQHPELFGKAGSRGTTNAARSVL